eukprot:33271_1
MATDLIHAALNNSTETLSNSNSDGHLLEGILCDVLQQKSDERVTTQEVHVELTNMNNANQRNKQYSFDEMNKDHSISFQNLKLSRANISFDNLNMGQIDSDHSNEDDLSDYKFKKGYESLSQINTSNLSMHHHNAINMIANKWNKMFTNSLFWIRILTLFLTIILLILCSAYCVGQLLKVELDLVTECVPKT